MLLEKIQVIYIWFGVNSFTLTSDVDNYLAKENFNERLVLILLELQLICLALQYTLMLLYSKIMNYPIKELMYVISGRL